MDAVELGAHAWQVLLGAAPPLSPASAQAVGPRDAGLAWAMLGACAAMLLVLLALERCGFALAAALGVRRQKQKFAHAFAELCYYSAAVGFLARACWDARWFWPAGWHEVMHDGRVQMTPELAPYTAPADLKFVYITATSYYAASLVLLLSRPKKKDCAEMALHHVITAALLLLSYRTGYLRIGVVVMALHDVFDPLMLAAKCAHYARVPVLPDIAFACSAVAFAVPRFWLFPRAIHHAWLGVCAGSASCPGGVWDKTPLEFTLVALLLALLPIHALWFAMILRVLRTAAAAAGVQGDVRSDSEDEEGDAHTGAPAKIKRR